MVAIFILSNLKFSFCKLIYPVLGIVIESYVASIVVRALLFNTDISLKIFANVSIGRIKYMNGINKVCTTSIVNSHTDRKVVFP